jgi:hypothetical protein
VRRHCQNLAGFKLEPPADGPGHLNPAASCKRTLNDTALLNRHVPANQHHARNVRVNGVSRAFRNQPTGLHSHTDNPPNQDDSGSPPFERNPQHVSSKSSFHGIHTGRSLKEVVGAKRYRTTTLVES